MTKPTFEERITALEEVCFGAGMAPGHTRPMDAAGVAIVEKIHRVICAHEMVQLPVISMRVVCRTKKVAFIRSAAMYLAVELSGLSLPQIARLFNRKAHGTVSHAHRKIGTAMKKDTRMRAFVQEIGKEI